MLVRVPLTAAVAALLVLAPTASAQPLACGDVVTHDVKLDADIHCPAPADPTGLVVGKSGITIDLNGHRITGGNSGIGGGGGIGIDNSGGFDRVTVKNGSIDLFSTAAVLTNADRNRLVNLNLFGASTAVRVTGGRRDAVRGTTILGRAVGLAASGSKRMRIVDNHVSSAFGVAMVLDVSSSRIARNGPGASNTLAGLIQLSGSNNRVVRNDAGAEYIAGISVAGSRNVVAFNRATGPGPPYTAGDGILVQAAATGTVVRRNVTNGNGDDGIDVESPSTRLAHNTANDNGDLGIEAVSGVIDGGGNHASGNGNPLQCLNVLCGP